MQKITYKKPVILTAVQGQRLDCPTEVRYRQQRCQYDRLR